jgi:hypothetical protein
MTGRWKILLTEGKGRKKIFRYNLFIQKNRRKTMQIRVFKRGGKRSTWLVGHENNKE